MAQGAASTAAAREILEEASYHLLADLEKRRKKGRVEVPHEEAAAGAAAARGRQSSSPDSAREKKHITDHDWS